jgi:hypothetical protein
MCVCARVCVCVCVREFVSVCQCALLSIVSLVKASHLWPSHRCLTSLSTVVYFSVAHPTCRTNENDHQSPESFAVEPGDVLTQALTYRAADRSYDMYIHSKNLGKSIKMNYKLLAKQVGSMSSGHMAACWWLTHLLLGPSAL